MAVFNGTIAVKVCEAVDLELTEHMKRFGLQAGQQIDPYVTVTVDEQSLGKTTVKQKTFSPIWNERFESKVQNGENMVLTVYHNSVIGADAFVANNSITMEELLQNCENKNGSNSLDIMVSEFLFSGILPSRFRLVSSLYIFSVVSESLRVTLDDIESEMKNYLG